ncbi:MAG: glycosyltransferase family 2 protein [Verrucomicrobia bacterium]|nr:glycosyltransferase family 2 protein [Verrucomicrobiota bacterium]
MLAIIPAFHEEKFIGQVVQQVLEQVTAALVVDDGSNDTTTERAAAAGARVIQHQANLGKGAALKTGIREGVRLGYSFFLFLDGDGQHDPGDIPAFFRAMNETKADLVVGNRMGDLGSMPLIRRWTNKVMSWQISLLCGMNLPDSQCGFRLARKEVIDVLLAPTEHFDFETEIILLASRQGYKIQFVPVRTIYAQQRSKIRPLRDTLRYLHLITRYSVKR